MKAKRDVFPRQNYVAQIRLSASFISSILYYGASQSRKRTDFLVEKNRTFSWALPLRDFGISDAVGWGENQDSKVPSHYTEI